MVRDEENRRMLQDAKKIKSGEWEEAIDERTGNDLYFTTEVTWYSFEYGKG